MSLHTRIKTCSSLPLLIVITLIATFVYRNLFVSRTRYSAIPLESHTMKSHTMKPHTMDIITVTYNNGSFKPYIDDPIIFCDEFNTLYLSQGPSIFELPHWYQSLYENDHNHMIFLYYNQTSFYNDRVKLSTLLASINQRRLKLVVVGAFNCSFAEGRNILLSYAFKYEHQMLQSKCNFNYVCLLDSDLQLVQFDEKHNNLIYPQNKSDYDAILDDFYFNFLAKYLPYVGIPHRVDPVKFATYPNIPIGFKYATVEVFDPMIAYYYRPLINNLFLFPLYTRYDATSWWWSGHIQRMKLRMLFPFEKYNATIMYMKTAVLNSEHSPYPRGLYGLCEAIYPLFQQYIEKYSSKACDINTTAMFNFIATPRAVTKTRWLSNISVQQFDPKKNDPMQYLNEFDLCNESHPQEYQKQRL
eukprot:13034_1